MTIKTPAQLKTEITADLPDNTSGLITPALLRTVTTDIVDTVASGANTFNVKQYGALGDAATDDTTAINAAIAALNAGTQGRLYFPGGNYKVTSTLTTISVSCIVEGDGPPNLGGAATPPAPSSAGGSLISFTSGSTNLLVLTGAEILVRDLGMTCTAGSVTAGAGITMQPSETGTVNLFNVQTSLFFINWDIQTGAAWFIDHCGNFLGVSIGLRVQNTIHADAGDWYISNSIFVANSTIGIIQILSASEGKIINCKVIGTTPKGIDVQWPNTGQGLFMSNCSIEGVLNTGLSLVGSGGVLSDVLINNCEFLLFGTSPLVAISLNNIQGASINNIVLDSGTYTAPFSITSCNNVSINGVTTGAAFATSAASLISGTPSVTGAAAASVGTIIGGGYGVLVQGCVSGAKPTLEITSGGGNTFQVTSGTSNDASFNLTNGTVIWTLAGNFSSANALILIHQGEAVILSIGAVANSDFAISARRLLLAAAVAARASLNIPTSSGTAPTSPVDGDMWYDGTNVKFRVGGTTKTFTLT